MDAEYTEKMQQVMATRPDPSCAYDLPDDSEVQERYHADGGPGICTCVMCDPLGAMGDLLDRERVEKKRRAECDLPEKREGEAVQTHGQAVRDIRYHRTQEMHVLRASDGAAIGYFPVRADAEQRMLSDEFVDAVKATVTVR